MKFWQKTFICTLMLFLVCLGVSIFTVGCFVSNRLEENYESTCLSEQFYITKAFSADCEYTVSTGQSVSELMVSYCEYYADNGIILAIEYMDDIGMPEGHENLCKVAFASGMPSVEDERTYFQREINGKRYIFIKSGLDNGSITYIKDISALDEDYKSMAIIFVVVSLIVALTLGILLFLILRGLSKPLFKLTESTKAIARGDYSVETKIGGNDEFSALADSFNNMTQQIRSQVTALSESAIQKQQLVDNLSHEMRTPLTSIKGYAEYLLTANVSEEERIDSLMCISSESERLIKLSQSLLDISYINGIEIKKEMVDISNIFDILEKRFAMKAKELSIDFYVEETQSKVYGNRDLIELLLSNFIDNAMKACKDSLKRKVYINAITTETGAVQIKVSDSGRGMTDEEIKHITEPFYRTDKARSRADGGAGLGLSLCLRIVNAHFAKLEFNSEVMKGTSVTVTFPNLKNNNE